MKLRYKQSLLGVAWVVLQPLLMMVAFTFVFDNIAEVPSQGLPYPVFVLAGLIPWQYFSSSTNAGSGSLIGSNMSLVTKVYFHRMVLPISTILTSAVDFGVSFVLLVIMMALYGIWPPVTILLIPFLAIAIVIISLAVSMPMSALAVKYRDVRYIFPFFISMLLFLTPVIYPGSSIESSSSIVQFIYALNPMVGIVEAFRWAMLGTAAPSAAFVLPGLLLTIVLLVFGSLYFLKTEQSFADMI